jgi:DNA-binding CsgD family transcriptional regulator
VTLSVSGRDAEAREILTRRAAEIDDVNVLAADLVDQLVLVAGCAHIAIEDLHRGQHLIERGVRGARDASAVGVLPFRLGRLAWAHYWQGRWTSAYALADEALRLAEDGGWLAEQPNSLATLARIESVTGRDDLCREHAELANAMADRSGIRTYHVYAELALGMLALSNGDDAEARQRLELVDTFATDNGTVDTPMMWWSADLVEAYTRLGSFGQAERVLRRFEATLDTRGGPPTGFAVAARSRALLEPDDFDRHLADALRWHDRSPVPFERARTELALGMHLRRSRLRREARRHLESALSTFDSLGAVCWARRSRAELEATGLHLTRPETGLAGLTPQELQVALHVARGLANREVAAQLFLSVKTVEFHLSNAFHKLGINRRTQLALMVAQHEFEAPELVAHSATAQ